MKKIIIFIAALCFSYYSFAQNGQILMDYGIIFSNFHPYSGYEEVMIIKYFDQELWTCADLDIFELEGKEVKINEYKIINKFGEMVAEEDPSRTKLMAQDNTDIIRIVNGSISKDGTFCNSYSSIYERKDQFGYKGVFQPNLFVIYQSDGKKIQQLDAKTDEKGRLIDLSFSIDYNANDRITKFEYHSGEYCNYVLQWVWNGDQIKNVIFHKNSLIYTLDIEIMGTFDNGKWRKARITEWKGNKKNQKEEVIKNCIYERIIE